MIARRPQSLAEYKALSGFMTSESELIGLSYQPSATDIFISPYAKCGTTWMQQIVHGLRTGGSMEFSEITEVVPWLELAHDLGIDVNAPQVADPRAFKSHLRWDEIPKGGRYIVVLRDPIDAMLSLFRFLEGWFFETESVSLLDFAEHYMSDEKGGYWVHLASWYRERHREEVLLVTFESMKQDLGGVVKRVADHMGGYDDTRCTLATKQASFAFMKAHATQFDDHLVRDARDPVIGLPPGGAASKVDKGKSGKTVPDEIRRAMDAKWQYTIGAEFGLKSYAKLQEKIEARRA